MLNLNTKLVKLFCQQMKFGAVFCQKVHLGRRSILKRLNLRLSVAVVLLDQLVDPSVDDLLCDLAKPAFDVRIFNLVNSLSGST